MIIIKLKKEYVLEEAKCLKDLILNVESTKEQIQEAVKNGELLNEGDSSKQKVEQFIEMCGEAKDSRGKKSNFILLSEECPADLFQTAKEYIFKHNEEAHATFYILPKARVVRP